MYTEAEGRKQEELLTACDYPDDRPASWLSVVCMHHHGEHGLAPAASARITGDQGCRSMGGNGAREAAVQRRPVAAPSTRQLFLTFVYSATSPLSPLPLVQRIPARPLSVSTVRSWRDRTCARACAHSTRRGNVRGCVKRSNGRGIFVSFIPFDST